MLGKIFEVVGITGAIVVVLAAAVVVVGFILYSRTIGNMKG